MGRRSGEPVGVHDEPTPPPATGGDSTGLSLKRQVGRSFGWALAGQFTQRGATFAATLLLARILDREDFGTYSIAVTITMFLLAINDLGMAHAISRHRDESTVATMAGTASTIAFSSSVALYLSAFFAAPYLVELFNPPPDSAAVGVVRLATLAVVIDGRIAASAGVITRALQERTRATSELTGTAAALCVNFSVALSGGGPWSLAAAQVTGSAVTATLLFLRSPTKVRFRWDREQARSLLRFGTPLIGAGALNQLILNSDYLIVNRYLGTAVAGAYFLAFNISNWPMTLIAFSMRRTAVAGFARLQGDPAAIQRAFVGAATLLISATLPMALLIGLLAPEVLTVAYGPKWATGATALRFLAGISVLRLFYALCVELLAALGRSGSILIMQVAWLVSLVAGMWWGAINHGLVGVGVAQLASALGVAMPVLFWLLQVHGVNPLKLLPRLLRPALGGLVMAGAVLAVRTAFDQAVVRLLLGGAAGTAVYAAIVLPGTPALATARRLARPRRGVAHS